MLQFTHLLTEAKSKYSSNLKPYAKTHDVLEVIEGFAGISFNYNMIPPIRIKTKPSIFILKRKEGVYQPPENYVPHEQVQFDEESEELHENVSAEEKEIINTSAQEDEEEIDIDKENDTIIMPEHTTTNDFIEMNQNDDNEVPQNDIEQKDVFRAKEAVRKLMKEKREIKFKIEELQQQIKQEEITQKEIISTLKVAKENQTITNKTEKKKTSQKIPQKVPQKKNDSLLIKITSSESGLKDQNITKKALPKAQPIVESKDSILIVQNKSDSVSSPVNKKADVATAAKNKTTTAKRPQTDQENSFTNQVNERIIYKDKKPSTKVSEDVQSQSQVVQESVTDKNEKDAESTNKINESEATVNNQNENKDFE